MSTKAFTDAKDGYTVDFGYPFQGSDPTPWAGTGMFGYVVFEKAEKERLKMLLNICNHLAAPFGTKEFELFNFGVEGKHFERGDGGVPEPTKLWGKENKTNYPISYIASAPITLFYPGYPDQVGRIYEWEKRVAEITIPNPMTGLRSQAVRKWHSKGGDDMAKELAEEYEATEE